MPAIASLVFQENTVNLLPISKPRAVLVWLAAGLSGAAIAQVGAPSPTTVLTAEPATTSFRSALDGYQPHTDEKIRSWKDANDTTARIGGWRAYAKEAQQGAAADTASQPDPHAGHDKPSQDKKP